MQKFIDNTKLQRAGLQALAAHLEIERETILQAWLHATEGDPALSVMAGLSHSEFYDHIPQVLDTLGDTLRAWPAPDVRTQSVGENEAALEHGAHRWQQGYNLQEMASEWSLFNVVMVEALDAYGAGHPKTMLEVLPVARRALAKLTGQSIASSVTEFERLQRAEAETRARDLEMLLGERDDRERVRGNFLRETSHDLRGSLGVVRGAARLLSDPRLAEEDRGELVEIIQQASESLHTMLSQMLDLARLDAGREAREIQMFDAALLLRQMGGSMQFAAQEKGLTFQCEGPDSLLVEGDAVKVGRIAQNLLLNAIHYTPSGSVSLSWSEQDQKGKQWALRVQDSGPGMDQSNAASLAHELQNTTQDSREAGSQSGPVVPFDDALVAPVGDTAPAHTKVSSHGEGVGLMIVKRLCELLDATLELDSRAGQGSLFRVVLPTHYSQ